MKVFKGFFRNVVSSNTWKKNKACLLKKMKLWLKTLWHAIDPSIYRGKKHTEQVTAVNMTVQLGRMFKGLLDGHTPTGGLFRNRYEVNQNKWRDRAKEA